MIAIDIAARGLDIDSIAHVLNYDMTDTADAYINRIGRTGRAQRTGDAFTLVTDEDRDMIRSLERIMGQHLKRETLPDSIIRHPRRRDMVTPCMMQVGKVVGRHVPRRH